MRLTEQQIAEMLPPPPRPAADYIPVREAAGMLHVAGQTPHIGGEIALRGVVGESVSPEDARGLARTAALNAVSALRQHLGDLNRISHFVSLTVFIAASPTFTRHPWVADGASSALVEIFGDAGRHARAAVGVASLPDGAPVEVSVIAYADPLPEERR